MMDNDIGVQKEQVVTRDGKADLAFTGALVASAAPPAATKGSGRNIVYMRLTAASTCSQKSAAVCSPKIRTLTRRRIFDPSPSSVPSQLLRSARELTRSKPLTWMDAAVAFFGYDPLAKTLYRKIGGEF